jgi:hypothetical protein
VRAEAKAAIFCLIGALLWFAPYLWPGKALLGTHPSLYRPFTESTAPDLLEQVKSVAHPLDADKLLQHDPEVRFSWRSRRDSLLPAWDPQVLGGLPHLAQGLSSSLHPFMWLARWIDPPRCYAVIAALQSACAAWFAFLMLRAFRVAPLAAGGGALLFAGSGWMSFHQEYFQLSGAATWLPLALCGARRIVDKAGGLLPLGIAVAGTFLSGFPQIACYVVLAAGILVAVTLAARLLRRTVAPRDAARAAGASALAVACGLAIASPQLLASAELLPLSTRAPLDAAILEAQALPPPALLGALFPDLLASSPTQAEYEAEEARAAREARPPRHETLFGLALIDAARPGPRNNAFELTFALGPAALLFALVGLFSRRRGAKLVFTLLLLAGLALALPGPLLRASAWIPGLNIGDPKRALFLAQAALGALAALGLERLLEDATWRRRTLVVAGGLALLLILLAAAAKLELTPAQLREWAAPKVAASVGLSVDEVRHGLPASLLADARELLNRELVFTSLAVVLAAVALLGIDRASGWRSLPSGALLFALALPLVAIWSRAASPIPTAGIDARPPLVDLLLKNPPSGRLIHVAPRGVTPVLPPKLPMLYGVRDAQGYVALYLKEWADLFEAVEPGSTMTVGIFPLSDPEKLELPLFDRLDVELALVETPAGAPVPVLAGWSEEPIPDQPAAPTGATEVHLYRNHEFLGRARFAHSVTVFDDEAAVVRRLASPDYDPRVESCVTADLVPQLLAAGYVELYDGPPDRRRLGWPPQRAFGDTNPVIMRSDLVAAGPDRLLFRCSGAGGLLVQSDCWYPGWRARIDGRDAPLLKVDHALRGVVLPAGDHEVEFAYVPRPLIAGLFLAPAAFALLTFSALLLGRRRRREAAARDTDAAAAA